METWPVVALMILVGFVLVGVLVALVVYRKRRGEEEVEVDYRAFFVMGICLLAMGILFSLLFNPGLLGIVGLGAFYIVLS
ncbi:TPA: hypothetical protein HA259_00545, partial [Thermoplasmata archaeon]|nr:hypothetical protein [Thermoplasmata archaeon]